VTLTRDSEAISNYFKWPSGICLRIQSSRFSKSLERELGALRTASDLQQPADAQIFVCRKKSELPVSGMVFRGRYKGIPWTMTRSAVEGGAETYFFYAPVFRTFLFVRTCLIPLLKKITIEQGGFFLIGSALMLRGTALILFGKPGSGKTRLLLRLLSEGGEFAGDSELILTSDKKILPVFPYFEARFKTLFGTPFWRCLSLRNKLYLRFCHALSCVSLGRISFNLLLDSVDSKKTIAEAGSADFSRSCRVIQLQAGGDDLTPLALPDLLAAVEQYETKYQSLFGEGVYTPELRRLGLSQLARLLSEAVLWKSASDTSAYLFLQKEIKSNEHRTFL